MSEESSVKVAVRIRPQIPREVIEMCHVCTSVTPREPQVWLGSDKAFTFDNVFDMPTQQEVVYETCIGNLIEGCLKGYNATVLAYGQTGSGKTYTMGTGFDISIGISDIGIIPRAVDHLFRGISEKQEEARENGQPPPDFKIVAQFMEIYNEEIIDLLDSVRDIDDKNRKSHVKIHEDVQGSIYTSGLTSRNVTSAEEALQYLKNGAVSRTTASTQMNVQSSRSHAIFTLHIKQQRVIDLGSLDEEMDNANSLGDLETLTAKFHFVDLAGSERLKRTGATGDRAKEGISINCGLLSLGNVISALGDKSRRATHIPYRDSKLTRLLQDSLGGNSQTLMIACISPSDRDFMETLNTLKYANRAKNIKNKVSVNQDKSSQMIAVYRREIQMLQLELQEYKQGKRVIDADGTEQVNDMFHENVMLVSENNNLRTRLKALQDTLEIQTFKVTQLLVEKSCSQWVTSGDNSSADITEIIKGYLTEIEDLRLRLLQSEEMCNQLRKQFQRAQTKLSFGGSMSYHQNSSFPNADMTGLSPTMNLIAEAKQDVEKLKKRIRTSQGDSASEKEINEEKQQLEENKETIAGGDNVEMNGECEEPLEVEMEEEDEEESSEDSDAEDKSATEEYRGNLADLTIDISMKQRLIEALEQNQLRLQNMRRHYEEKVIQLEQKIRETEIERDRVLASLSHNKENRTSENVKKVKVEFEKKLSSLQTQLKKMQVAKKEHAQLMRNQSQYERQINQLKNELSEMKRMKVKLMNKIKEENQRHKSAEQKTQKEITQLKKQSRVRENRIRNLENEKKLKENVLRRKHEELIALRRSNKPMSDQVAGRVPHSNQVYTIKRSLPFSPKVAKCRWQKLEKSINQLVIGKQTVFNIEKDMERSLEGREKLTRRLEALQKQKIKATSKNKDNAIIQDYEDEIENLKANIDYFQENITDCQTSIVQMEETKDDMDLLDVKNLVYQLSRDESRYLLEKLLNMVIHQTFQVVQKETVIKEMEAKLEQTKSSNDFQVQLLELFVKDGNPNVLELINANPEPVSESQFSSRSSSPIDSSISEVSAAPNVGVESPKLRRTKKITGAADLLNTTYTVSSAAGSCPTVADIPEKPQTSRLAWSFGPALQQELDSAYSALQQNTGHSERGIVRVTSAPTSLREMGERPKLECSPLAKRKYYDRQLPDVSPAFRRKFYPYASVIPPSLSRQSSVETTASDITPPSSPTATRKPREDNVFSRLTSGSFRSNKPGRGVIAPFVSKMNSVRNSPLICTHVAEGHIRAVLSVAATDDVLFSGSKDRTVKIWDLNTGKEIQSLGGHPNNVCAVRYTEYSRLAFSVSTAFIKVWDVRENPAKCIKTLCSSGSNNPATPILNTPSRTLIMPSGETQIHDIALNRYGTMLFSAAGNIVRMWDLRMFQSIGKLIGGHQAAVMCLAVDNRSTEKNIVVTGSKDHYIKVFEVMERSTGTHSPKTNLDPPHYDGIQSLAINDDFLFSGSRDSCIKKWNLKKRTHVQSLNQAHKDWVCALCFLPSNNSLLSSGCRSGFLKLWAADTTQLIGEIKAHSAPINSIAANSTCLFTASNDCTVGMWRLRNSSDISPDYNNANEEKIFA